MSRPPAQADANASDDSGASADDHATGDPGREEGGSLTLEASIEALLLSTDRPLPTSRLAELTGRDAGPVNHAIHALNFAYESTGRSFRIEAVAGGWQILTLPAYAPLLSALQKSTAVARLSPSAMETLAIIAYRQPILRADIEAIRGVACGEVLRSLMERRLIRIAGRSEDLGRPILYGTTRGFLEVFGLATIKDLPKVEDFLAGRLNAVTGGADQPASQEAAPASPTSTEDAGDAADAAAPPAPDSPSPS